MGTQLEWDSWLINYGVSFHMTLHRNNWFCGYKELEGGDVLLGDDSPTKIVAQGKVWLILKDGRRGTIMGMLNIPSLARNVIYVSRMSDAGVHTLLEKDTWKMVWEALVFMRGIRIGTLYKLLGRIDGSNYYHIVILENDEISSCVVNSTMLWHQWLGHIGKKGLHVMHNKGMVQGFPDCSFEFDCCEHRVYGKQNHVSFPTGATREKIILEEWRGSGIAHSRQPLEDFPDRISIFRPK